MNLEVACAGPAVGVKAWPLVGVVIPVFNDWAGLQHCLQALSRQDYPRDCLRVRVVDNGSSDWPAVAGFPIPVEVLKCPEPGSYRARNRAARGWAVDVLAFTDADCRPDPHWLRAGVECLQANAGSCDLVAGAIQLVVTADPPGLGEQLDQLFGFDQQRSVRRGGYGATANLLVRQSLFEALGGFEAATRSGADRSFCRRAVAEGHALHYCPAAVVHHPARRWPELVLKQRRIVGGRLALAPASPLARLGVLLVSVRPCLRQGWLLLRQGRIPPRRRLQLVAAAVGLRGLVALEWLRLQWPGQLPLR